MSHTNRRSAERCIEEVCLVSVLECLTLSCIIKLSQSNRKLYTSEQTQTAAAEAFLEVPIHVERANLSKTHRFHRLMQKVCMQGDHHFMNVADFEKCVCLQLHLDSLRARSMWGGLTLGEVVDVLLRHLYINITASSSCCPQNRICRDALQRLSKIDENLLRTEVSHVIPHLQQYYRKQAVDKVTFGWVIESLYTLSVMPPRFLQLLS